MSRILALILGIAGLLSGTSLPDVPVYAALTPSSAATVSAEAEAETQPSAHVLATEHKIVEHKAAELERNAESDALKMSLVEMESKAADRVVYAAGDAGVALRGTSVSAHVGGVPVSRANVRRVGNGVQVYDQSALVAEVALRATPNGLAVDWIWAPKSYYAVTFPSLGVRVTGMRSDPGEESMDALRVTDVDPGSPAEASGLTAGSRIDAILTPSTYESSAEIPATPLALRHALDQARRTSSPFRLRIQPSETDDGTPGRIVAVAPGSMPIQ